MSTGGIQESLAPRPFFVLVRGYGSVVSILLAHPTIDVNLWSDYFGATPFLQACLSGHTSCFRLLLKDSRVLVKVPNNSRRTPLWLAAFDGFLDVITWWIASGREMNLGAPEDRETDAIGVAERRGETEVVTLLERFKENPEKIREAMRLELGWYDEAAAEIFALVVLVSDGLLQFKDTTTTPAEDLAKKKNRQRRKRRNNEKKKKKNGHVVFFLFSSFFSKSSSSKKKKKK